jgi:predicted transcriptional regulator of viral defense system
MVERGEILRISRGLYGRLDTDASSHHSLVEAQMIVGSGVVCLLSALSFHEIGTQSPRMVWIAVARGSRVPRTAHQPIRVVSFSGRAFTEGIEEHLIEGVAIGVYSAAKTVADCFKYRFKLGTDVAIEALHEIVQSRKASADELLHFADICRVRSVMTPYLESVYQRRGI